MGNENSPRSGYGSDWPHFPSLDDWLDELDGYEIDDDSYPRSMTAVIPRIIADVYDTATLTVPIRALLTLAALHNPKDAERFLALRDAHYGGDCEADYFFCGSENINRSMTREERAMAKVARAKGFEKREAKRLSLEAEAALPRRQEEPLTYDDWHPFREERAELAAEFEALRQREDARALEWESIAADSRTHATDYACWANRYADLLDEDEAIARGYHEWAERYERLSSKVYAVAREQLGRQDNDCSHRV